MATDNVTPLHGADRAELRRLHHGAADELIEDAIRLLSLLELLNHVDVTVDPQAVATAASTIVEKLRKAQSHHREAMP